ncbi:ribonuclease P protein component [Candidatus Collierbacteria bacterium RIFCSPLOWO2_01_FULL_50_23]|uniref:Ribonuclease P protein component n=2 Tax=Candidatus Collieribacteriota TaxID=1752725 RepID=A0A1F5EY92_9BACT|nr:MAG: ribonuclease P protein component [Candidatus Collierbacteria bacterium RIFCSPHIGHO2_01_FULL_50_25]OGD72104.1 MAG: ribonuclease P protein component [Candidatus Collierbacteria bacterium RIFCSPHIGHO2_02_FULL_49_10]OGD74687.1 MAG: ribonuclease P protein component [Candidatus Collierbacteria bacterium RIFCSPLOWO2_01_FULL_50_23]
MLSKANRLSLKTDRFRIESEGGTLSSSFFTFLIAPRADISSPIRLTVLVSKKFLVKSSDRHQLKRRLTEILRLNLSKLPGGIDVILIPKRSLLGATTDQILADLIKILNTH